MDNPDDNLWRRAWMDWANKRQRCQNPSAVDRPRPAESPLGACALLVVATLVTSVMTTLLVLERWRNRVGDDMEWNGGKEQLIRMIVGQEIYIELNRPELDTHFTLQASDKNDDEGVLIGWRSARYSLSENRAYVVPSSDYYMIYTCLSFMAPPSAGEIVFWQELLRHSQGGGSNDAVLMKDVQTERCNSQAENVNSFCRRSLITGILRLRQGDRIYLRASYPHLVSRVNGTSYFGVLRMN